MMNQNNQRIIQRHIIDQATAFGASLAGIASATAVRSSHSYEAYGKKPYYDSFEGLPDWPEDAKSILIFALIHSPEQPDLDWWDPHPGGTLGNRELMQIQKKVGAWLREEKSIEAHPLPYRLEQGGVLLKDASALAGLGVIGKNNLLLTPQHGPRVRLRAMFLDVALEPGGLLDFDPCSECSMPCFDACPQQAFRSGRYERQYCQVQMRRDEGNPRYYGDKPAGIHVRYCRACELACPVAR